MRRIARTTGSGRPGNAARGGRILPPPSRGVDAGRSSPASRNPLPDTPEIPSPLRPTGELGGQLRCPPLDGRPPQLSFLPDKKSLLASPVCAGRGGRDNTLARIFL